MKSFLILFASAVLAITAVMPTSFAMQAGGTAPAADKGKATKSIASPAPSTQEIADAKSKGLVWVNLNTRVYHKEGSFYGTTKRGKFMTEDEAMKAGYRAAKEPGTKKPGTAK